MTAQTEALRKLADFIDEHAELNIGDQYDQGRVHADGNDLGLFPPYRGDSAKEKEFVRKVIRALGGLWEKDPNGSTMYFKQEDVFGYFSTTIYVDRDAVCERKLVGTKDVEVPAQEAVEAHVETVPLYEWECGSLLALSEPERELVDA